MKITRKGMALSLAACITLSPMVTIGEDMVDEAPAIIPISAPIETPQVQAEYIKFKGKITKIEVVDDNTRILAENDLEEGLDALYAYISDDVILLNDKTIDFIEKEDLKEGMEVSIYYHKDTVMALSHPPMLGPDVVVVNEGKDAKGVEVSKFNKDFLNSEGSLYVRPGKDTIIIDKAGNKVEKEALVDRDWIAFYSVVLESYPGQTSPHKVILMPQREELPQSTEIVLKDEVYKNDKGVLMIPLRQVAEGLGYKVTWNQEAKSAEILKGPQWSLVTIGEDKYNFARMHIELGTAPVLKDSKTYVPISFAEQVLKAVVEITEDGTVKIIQ